MFKKNKRCPPIIVDFEPVSESITPPEAAETSEPQQSDERQVGASKRFAVMETFRFHGVPFGGKTCQQLDKNAA